MREGARCVRGKVREGRDVKRGEMLKGARC